MKNKIQRYPLYKYLMKQPLLVEECIETCEVILEDAATAERVLLLAMLTYNAEPPKMENFKKLASKQLAKLNLLESAMTVQTIALGSVDVGCFKELKAVVESFKAAIAPRRVDKLSQQNLEDRLAAFITNGQRSDEEMKSVVKQHLQAGCADVGNYGRFLKMVPLVRLRTYPKEQLRDVYNHFRHWEMILSDEAQLEKEYAEARKWLTRKWSGLGDTDATVDEALQEAAVITLENQTKPGKGYSFESDIKSWLYHTASNIIRKIIRGGILDPIPPDLPQEPDNDAYPDEVLFFIEYQERFELALSFFQQAGQKRVRLMWKMALEGINLKNKRLVLDKIKDVLGEQVNLTTISQVHTRFKQRMFAVNYIRDGKHRDAPHDLEEALLKEKINSQIRKMSDPEQKAVRHLAALTRTAESEKSLGWALLARLLIDKSTSFEEIRDHISEFPRIKDDPANCDRFTIAEAWRNQVKSNKAIKGAKRFARDKSVPFFVSPIWYLVALQNINDPKPQTAEILKPANKEVTAVYGIVHHLLKGRQNPMDSDQQKPPPAPRQSPPKLSPSEAKQAIISFLVGDHYDVTLLATATQTLTELDPDTLADLRHLVSQQPKTNRALVLAHHSWHWAVKVKESTQFKLEERLSIMGEELGKTLGDWSLTESPRTGLALPTGTQPSLGLTTTLPDDAANITLHIIPNFIAARHQYVWELKFLFSSDSNIGTMLVGIGDAEDNTTGYRILRDNQPVTFQVPPPGTDRYWVYLRWKTDTWHSTSLEINLGTQPEEHEA